MVGGWYNCEFSVIPLPTRAWTGKGWPTQAWTGKGRAGAMAGINNYYTLFLEEAYYSLKDFPSGYHF